MRKSPSESPSEALPSRCSCGGCRRTSASPKLWSCWLPENPTVTVALGKRVMGFTFTFSRGLKVRSSLAMDCRRSAVSDTLPQSVRRGRAEVEEGAAGGGEGGGTPGGAEAGGGGEAHRGGRV